MALNVYNGCCVCVIRQVVLMNGLFLRTKNVLVWRCWCWRIPWSQSVCITCWPSILKYYHIISSAFVLIVWGMWKGEWNICEALAYYNYVFSILKTVFFLLKFCLAMVNFCLDISASVDLLACYFGTHWPVSRARLYIVKVFFYWLPYCS